MNELKMKMENIKEEVTHDMENLRKKNQAETQNTVEGHHNRLEQVEDRNSEVKDKIEIKEKTEEQLVKQLKSCERNIHELTGSIKRTNMRIMDIEGEEVQPKGIHNIVDKITTEHFPKLKKDLPFRYRKPSVHETYLTKIESLHDILSLKQQTKRIVKVY
jgi:chromosome segregation ATPase